MDRRIPRRLGLFAKHWAPGRAKTRLAATIGEAAASAAAERFLKVTMSRLSAVTGERLLAYTPVDQKGAFADLEGVAQGEWGLAPQSEAIELGERMASFFRSAFSEGAEAVVLVGSDSPDLPLPAMERAFEWLNEPGPPDRLVFGPTSDGGYWLIGARGELGPAFTNLPWSSQDLMLETIRILEAAGWSRGREYELIDEWYDVDTSDDLVDLCQRIESNPDADRLLISLAEESRRWLAVPDSNS